MATRSWLMLFDIDGTILLSGRAGQRGLNVAFAQLFGFRGAFDGIPMAGRTDRAIVLDALRLAGRPEDDTHIALVREAYCAALADEIGKPSPHPSHLLPGVEALLDDLERRPEVGVGLLTGNFERGAAIKLGHFAVAHRFGFGAYGDDHVQRRDLVPVALSRAERHGAGVNRLERVVVIGDTPLDVDCAHAHGARAVGVATGGHDIDALRACGADLVLESLEDRATLHDWLARLGGVRS